MQIPQVSFFHAPHSFSDRLQQSINTHGTMVSPPNPPFGPASTTMNLKGGKLNLRTHRSTLHAHFNASNTWRLITGWPRIVSDMTLSPAQSKIFSWYVHSARAETRDSSILSWQGVATGI